MAFEVLTPFQTTITTSALCGILCIFFVFWLVIGLVVAKDAEERGMSGVFWFFIVFLFGVIGAVIYLLLRKDKYPAYPPVYTYPAYPPASPAGPTVTTAVPPAAGERTCPTCKATAPDWATFCPTCGNRMT